MQTRKQFFEEYKQKAIIAAKERKEKQRKEILEEIYYWGFEKLKEAYVKKRIAFTSHCGGMTAWQIWDLSHDECCICDIEYIGVHEHYCDNCWAKNKNKTLEELE